MYKTRSLWWFGEDEEERGECDETLVQEKKSDVVFTSEREETDLRVGVSQGCLTVTVLLDSDLPKLCSKIYWFLISNTQPTDI